MNETLAINVKKLLGVKSQYRNPILIIDTAVLKKFKYQRNYKN